MLVPDRRAPAQHIVGIIVRIPVDRGLHAMGVPSHDDVREQGEGARDGAELLGRAAVFRGDHPIMDGTLKTMDGFALIEQIKDLRAEYRIAEIVADTSVRLKAKQIQLVIILCSIVSVGRFRKCCLYLYFFEYRHRNHL
jgi:CheY-like chemotaxis protein